MGPAVSLPHGLSVSSVGSWALQHFLQVFDGWLSQYLSVSSVGSWALQLFIFARRGSERVTFSILSRIVGAATCFRFLSFSWWLLLSVSSVGSWALQPLAMRMSQCDKPHFQYPQSDRGRCNLDEGRRYLDARRSFSILSRIVGAATMAYRWLGAAALFPFSILSRIVGAATLH